MEVKNYSTGVRWLYDILYNVLFTTDRVGVLANKIINDVARYVLFQCTRRALLLFIDDRMKREGSYVSEMILNHSVFNEGIVLDTCTIVHLSSKFSYPILKAKKC